MKRWLSQIGPVALVVVTALLVVRLNAIVIDPADPVGSLKAGRGGLGDFRDVIYFPLKAVSEGVNPYDCGEAPLADGSPRYRQRYPTLNLFPLYSPLIFVLYWPFGWFDFGAGAVVYVFCNYVLALVLAYVVARYCQSDLDAAGKFDWKFVCGLAALILITHAGRSNFMGGENALPLTLASIGAIAWGRNRPWLAGAALALTSMKPTYGLPLGILMLCRGDWRSVLIGWTASAVIGIGGLLVVFSRSDDLPRMVDILRENQAVLEQDPEADSRSTSSRIDTAGALVRLFPGDLPAESLLASILVLAITGVVVVGAARLSDERTRDTIQAAAIALGTVTCLYRLPYDALLLWLPIGLCFLSPTVYWNSISTRWKVAFGCLLLAPMLNLFASSTFLGLYRRACDELAIPSDIANIGWTGLCVANGLILLAALLALLAMVISRHPEAHLDRNVASDTHA